MTMNVVESGDDTASDDGSVVGGLVSSPATDLSSQSCPFEHH